jgi:PAS domain S-box-containing protein
MCSTMTDDELIKIIQQLKNEIVERRWAEKKANDALDYAESIIDSMGSPIVVIDEEEKLVSTNVAFLDLFNLSPKDTIGKRFNQLSSEIATIDKLRALIGSNEVESESIEIDHDFKVLGRKVLKVSMANLQYNVKHLLFKLLVFEDVTEERKMQEELKKAAAQQGKLVRELNHRVRNNLQVLESLYDLQFNSQEDEGTKALLLKNKNRISTISLMHHLSYSEEGVKKIPATDILDGVLKNVCAAYPRVVTVREAIDGVEFDLTQSVNVGLVFNEILSNAYQFAFPSAIADPMIDIEVAMRDEGRVAISIGDNGAGLGAEEPSPAALGFKLIKSIAEGNLRGTWSMTNGRGVRHRIEFPLTDEP